MFDGDYPIGPVGDTTANIACYGDWLAQLCLCVPHTKEGYMRLSVQNESKGETELASHPLDREPESCISTALERAAKTRQTCFENFNRGDEALSAVICSPGSADAPYFANSNSLQSVALVFPRLDTPQLEALARLIKNSFAWLNLVLDASIDVNTTQRDNDDRQHSLDQHSVSSEVFEPWLTQATASGCALAIANSLAANFACERVVIMQLDSKIPEIAAVSGLTSADPRQQCNQICVELTTSLATVGDGLFQSLQQDENQLAAVFHRYSQFAKAEKFAAVLHTTSGSSRFGIIFEWPDDQLELNPTLSQAIERTAASALEILSMKISAQPSLVDRVLAGPSNLFAQCVGAGNLKTKLILLAIVSFAIISSFVPFAFKVSAPITLEGATQRAIVAPFETYVKAAHVQAGMTVQAGQVLVELDQTKFELEQDKWSSEIAKLNREYDRALAELNHSQAQIIRAQLGQAEAELKLVNNKLLRTVLYAPFDGVVISGDLSRSVGTPASRGELLLEIAPLTGYRVVLSVDERDISNLRLSQQGELTLNALPSKRWQFEVGNIASAAPSEDGEHLFRVEAKLAQTSDQLRPGMQGIGKIHIGQESLAYIMSRRLLGWLQLNLWSIVP